MERGDEVVGANGRDKEWPGKSVTDRLRGQACAMEVVGVARGAAMAWS